MTRSIIVVVGLIGFLFSQTTPPYTGEILTYATGFRLFSAGTSTIEVINDEEDTLLHIISQVRTSGFFDHIYRVRDRIDLWLDPTTLELRRMQRDIHEGKYERKDTTVVDREAGLIFASRDTLAVDGPVYDPVGVIYYLRSLPLDTGDKIDLSIFDGRRLQNITITVTGSEQLKVPAGEFECLVLLPEAQEGERLTKVDGLLNLWLAQDSSRTPVRLEQTSSIGTMVLKLKELQ